MFSLLFYVFVPQSTGHICMRICIGHGFLHVCIYTYETEIRVLEKVPRSRRFCVFLCWERTGRGGPGVLCYAYPYRGVYMWVMNSLWACVCVWVRERLLRKSASVKAFLRFFLLRANLRRRGGEALTFLCLFRNSENLYFPSFF